MTPEQLERRRLSRERWRAAHPYEWRDRRARKRLSASGSPAPDAAGRSGSLLPDAAGRSGSPAAITAELATLERLRAEIETVILAASSGVPDGPAVRQRSGSPAAPKIPPLARDVQSGPPPEVRNYPAVSLAAAARASRPAAAAAAARNAAASVDPWQDAAVLELLEAKNLRPGPMRALMAATVGSDATACLRDVLKFVNRQFPAPVPAADGAYSPRRAEREGRGSGDEKPWIVEHMAAVERQQAEMLGVAF